MQQPRSSRLLSLLLSFLFCLVSLIPSASATAAEWTVEDLDALQDAFVARISASYSSIEYPWQFVIDCTAQNCYNSNPDSPYGIPVFPTKAVMARQFSPAAAFVAIMETPPPMRYFGVTPYLFTRTYTRQIGSNPSTPGTIPVFMSLTDTFNLRTIATSGSLLPGENTFTQLSAFIMTADRVTANEITSALTAIGFPDYAINQVALPVTAVPLTMGLSPTADTFTLLLRVAYPDDPDQLADYLTRVPMRALYLTPVVPRRLSPVATPVYRIPGNGQPEPSQLSTALSRLVYDLKRRFSDYTFTASGQTPFQTKNYVCAQYAVECKGDNSDAVYKTDVSETYIPASREDRILIVGVNHVNTGKATYFSHSIVDPSNASGVQAIGDAWLAGTALAMTGVQPGDARYSTYRQLYAFTMSYDCGDDPVCITIPEGEGGVPFGNPFSVTGRVYLDPATKTRPSLNEIIMPRAFILKKK